MRLILILSLIFPVFVVAFDKYIFSGEARNLRIFNQSPTLMVFQSPVIAQVCQPSNIVKFYAISSQSDLAYSIKTMEMSNQIGEDRFELMLKSVPQKPKGKAKCGFHLKNGDKITVEIELSKDVVMPIVEMTSIWSDKSVSAIKVQANKTLDVFKYLLTGAKISGFIEKRKTKTPRLVKTTKNFSYRVKSIQTDMKSLVSYEFDVEANTNLLKLPDIKTTKIGQYLYSAWLEDKKLRTKTKVLDKDKLRLFVLARAGLSLEEVIYELP